MGKSNGNGNDPVATFLSARKNVLKHFGCDEDYFVKPMLGMEWLIRTVDDFRFLTYWPPDGKKMDAVVVSRNGQPMVFKTNSYTMVIGIDCVKMAFIFNNKYKRNS